MAATIKDIAKSTHLSIATISNYINGIPVRPQNAAIIKKAIQDSNYRVNTIARGLKTNKSLLLGALIPSINEIFSLQIMMVIDKYISSLGYSSLICDCHLDSGVMIKKIQLLLDKQIDGLFIFPLLGNPQLLSSINNIHIPVVVIDQQIPGANLDTVLVDNEEASFNVINNFIQRGHKRIGIICGPEVNYTSSERLKGYLRAYKMHQIPIDNSLIAYGDFTTKSGYDIMHHFWKRQDHPTAVYATNHYTTTGAMLATRELNINIGEEMELFAFDNYEIARIAKPPLPVVLQPLDEIGQVAAEIMMKRLSQNMEGFPQTVVLPTEIRYTLTQSI